MNVDRRHKLVRRYKVTDAAVHDGWVVEVVSIHRLFGETLGMMLPKEGSVENGAAAITNRECVRNTH